MKEIILNEKQWIEDMIDNSKLGDKPVWTLSVLAKYYRELGYKDNEIVELIEDFIIRCDKSLNVVTWQSIICRVVKNSKKSKLMVIDPIVITTSEIASIQELKGTIIQRFMFAILCLAKYANAKNPNNNYWINTDTGSIANLANISVGSKRRELMINTLWNAGYVGFNNIVDNTSINVKIVDDNSNAEIVIDDFRNLGNQYMNHIFGGFINCAQCGITIKRKSPNHKYCKECALSVNICNIQNRRRTNAS